MLRHARCTPQGKERKGKERKGKGREGKGREGKQIRAQSNMCPLLRQRTPLCKLRQLCGSMDQAFD